MRILVKWATLTLAIYLLAKYTGYITIADNKTAVLAALALGILNILVRPILKILTLPINLLTFGLFTLIINGFVLTIVPHFINGFTVRDFWAGVISALLISIFTSILNAILVPKTDD